MIKVGDLVYYVSKYDKQKKYCIVKQIDGVGIFNEQPVWGRWEDNIQHALKESKRPGTGGITWVSMSEVKLAEQPITSKLPMWF
jgi:hypothetical protein